MIALFLAEYAHLGFTQWLTCTVPQNLTQPWRLLTYGSVPFEDIIWFLFGCAMLYMFGGSLERSWGTRAYAFFYVGLCLVTALAVVPIGLYERSKGGLGVPVPYILVLGALVVAWCMLNPDETVLVSFVIPLKARYLALVECLIIFFGLAWGMPLLGLSYLGGCAFSYLWVRSDVVYRLQAGSRYRGARQKAPKLRMVPNASKREVPPDDRAARRNLNPLAWVEEERRRRKFERLMKDD